MNAAMTPTIKMPNQGNFIKDDRPDTRAERCMTKCKPIGTVADAEPRSKVNADVVQRAGGTGGHVIMGTTAGTGAGSKRP